MVKKGTSKSGVWLMNGSLELSFLATFDKYMMCHIEFSSDKNKLVFYFWISWSYGPSYGSVFIRCAAIFFRKWFPDSSYQRFWANLVEFFHSTQTNWINNIIHSFLCKKIMKNVHFIDNFDFLKLLLERPVDRAWLSKRHFQNQNKNKSKNLFKVWSLEEM